MRAAWFVLVGAVAAIGLLCTSCGGKKHEKEVQNTPQKAADSSARSKAAVTEFWDTYRLLFSAPVNSAYGANDIANKLEVRLTNDLDKRFRDFGAAVIKVLRTLAANSEKHGGMQQLMDATIAYLSGSVPSIDLGAVDAQDAQFREAFGILTTGAVELRLLAEREFDYKPDQQLHYSWTWTDGFFTDDYTVTNKNNVAWVDVTIRIACLSGVSGTWEQSENFAFPNIDPGQTIRFDNLFTSSERCDGHTCCILVKTSRGTTIRTWRCHSKTGAFSGFAGMVYHWEFMPGYYYNNDKFLTLDGKVQRTVQK